MKKFSKKASIEMSMGTIVVIVLSVTILIFGMIFIKNIMCSGIIMTNQIDEKVSNEIKSLFGSGDYGVRCMGEGGQEVTIGDGGKRHIVCIISTDTQYTYNLNIKSVESISNTGASTSQVQKWIISEDWTGLVSVGQTAQTVLLLDIPRGISATTLKIIVEETVKETGSMRTHTLFIDVKHLGQIAATIC